MQNHFQAMLRHLSSTTKTSTTNCNDNDNYNDNYNAASATTANSPTTATTTTTTTTTTISSPQTCITGGLQSSASTSSTMKSALTSPTNHRNNNHNHNQNHNHNNRNHNKNRRWRFLHHGCMTQQQQHHSHHHHNHHASSSVGSRVLIMMSTMMGMMFLVGFVNHCLFQSLSTYSIISDAAAAADDALHRRYRFPSVEDRVKLYMSSWYLPYCNETTLSASASASSSSSTTTRTIQKPVLERTYFRVPLDTTITTDEEMSSIISAFSLSSNTNTNTNTTTLSYPILQVTRGDYRLNFSGYAKTFEPLVLSQGLLYHCRLTEGELKDRRMKHPNWHPAGIVWNRGNTITYCIDTYLLSKELNDNHHHQHHHRDNNESLSSSASSSASSSTSASLPSWLLLDDTIHKDPIPLLSQFGDKLPHTNAQIPMIVKWRPSLSPQQLQYATSGGGRSCWPIDKPRSALSTTTTMTASSSRNTHHDDNNNNNNNNKNTFNNMMMVDTPILWKLVSARHFQPVNRVAANDIPWKKKLNKAVWRGGFTGIGNPGSPDNDNNKIQKDALELCLSNLRCTMVYHHASRSSSSSTTTTTNSKNHHHHDLIDIGFDSTLGYIPKTLHGVNMTKPALNMKQLLKYKMLISLEGNDVASGFKWNLYSQSVVLCPIPTKTTYAMEELLQPWVHYIPIARDGSDLQQQVLWVLTHDDEAHAIAQRGTQWMHDLLYHPLAQEEETQIRTEILQRYRNLWTATTTTTTTTTTNV